MNWRKEGRILILLAGIFLLLYFLPVGVPRFDSAVLNAFELAKLYAREHVLSCLIPALFIAGAVSVFLRQESVMRHLGPNSNRLVAYGVASVAGTILAVCSCTVLPLFAGIYVMGAGLGPATAFLYSGPAINVLAIVLTARVLGPAIGLGRALGAIGFSVLIGLCMHFLFRKEEAGRKPAQRVPGPGEETSRPLWKTALYFASMVGILVFANWAGSGAGGTVWETIFHAKWALTGICGALLLLMLVRWFDLKWWKAVAVAVPVILLGLTVRNTPVPAFTAGIIGLSLSIATSKGELAEWFAASWGFTKQIVPLLLGGVLIAGALFGRPGQEGLVPAQWIYHAVGGNGVFANLTASVIGALMYFATLTEVPIVQGLIYAGMGTGPALALLLAGPALSLPSMLVIRSVLGTRKAVAFIGLVVVMSTITGCVFGMVVG